MKALLILLIAGTFIAPVSAHAQGLPFGGLVTVALPCPTAGFDGEYIKVKNINPLLGGTFVIMSTTINHAFFFVKPFDFVLGNYIPAPNIGCGVPARGIIIRKGSSL